MHIHCLLIDHRDLLYKSISKTVHAVHISNPAQPQGGCVQQEVEISVQGMDGSLDDSLFKIRCVSLLR